MQVLHEQFENDPLVSVLAVHFSKRDDPAAYLRKHGYTFPLIPDGSSVIRQFGVTGIPMFMVIDRDGRIVYSHQGKMTDDVREAVARAAVEARRG